MSYIEEENVRTAAVQYLKRQLGQGKALAKLLLKTVDFDRGHVAILSPAPLNPAEITQFDRGHAPPIGKPPSHITIGGKSYLAVPKANAKEQLVQVIYRLLESPNDVCLLENTLAEKGDAWLDRAKSRLATYGTDVYHVLTYDDRTESKIADAIREADSVPTFVGALGRPPADPTGTAVTTEQLTNFAKAVQCLFVGAYDGEGYVLWTSCPSGLSSAADG